MAFLEKLGGKRAKSWACGGMSMVELIIAMTVLAVGMAGMLGVFAKAVQGNGRSKADTSGTMLAQTVLDKISASITNPAVVLTIQDCSAGGGVVWNVATAPGGAALDPNGTGNIDWINQAYAAAPANYKMLYVDCGNNGRQVTYDVRWNIQAASPSGDTRLITVSARAMSVAGATGTMYAQPITLRSIGGL
ncbi:MAG TPA: prepilin-type N-terminal cleavage/methylation domain-containing protein [Terriglobales bacterium]|nr:prepilin-type N-terminal cleavage/methylation domain-containing protein [Terriglobales bacterium]